MTTQYKIIEMNRVLMERQEPTFYAKIPKMVQLDLDPYELALYTNYKQTASDNPNGGGWKSNETLSKECGMSPRKITDVRKSLVDKGYIHCQYETSKSGKEHSAAIVTIVDVWAENHARFSKQETEGIAPDANPPSHDMLTPLAPDANKEELINKNQLKKKASPLPPEGDDAPTAFDVMRTAVKRLLRQYDKRQLDSITKTLLRQHIRNDSEKNLYRAINVSELEAFCVWWDKKKDRDGNKLTRPKNQASVLNAVTDWLDIVDAQPKKTSTPANLAYDFTPDYRSEDEIRAAMERGES